MLGPDTYLVREDDDFETFVMKLLDCFEHVVVPRAPILGVSGEWEPALGPDECSVQVERGHLVARLCLAELPVQK